MMAGGGWMMGGMAALRAACAAIRMLARPQARFTAERAKESLAMRFARSAEIRFAAVNLGSLRSASGCAQLVS